MADRLVRVQQACVDQFTCQNMDVHLGNRLHRMRLGRGNIRRGGLVQDVIALRDDQSGKGRVAGQAVAARVSWQLDPVVDRLVSSWPQAFAADRGKSLGMTIDAGFDDIVRAHIDATH